MVVVVVWSVALRRLLDRITTDAEAEIEAEAVRLRAVGTAEAVDNGLECGGGSGGGGSGAAEAVVEAEVEADVRDTLKAEPNTVWSVRWASANEQSAKRAVAKCAGQSDVSGTNRSTFMVVGTECAE